MYETLFSHCASHEMQYARNENKCVHGFYLRQPKCQMCVYLHEAKKKNNMNECGPVLNCGK